MGQDIRAWPMLALLLLSVLVAIGCVLWFMREAMRNERLAVRQKLADAYRGQLAFVQQRVLERWMKTLAQFDSAEPAAALFAHAASEGWADGAIFLDAEGRALYPRIGGQERLAAANAELLALENDPQNAELAARLRARVSDYASRALPSTQRRFLMREMQRLFPGENFPTLAAEDLAARYLEAPPARPEALRPSGLPNIWHTASPGGRAIVLFQTAKLRAQLEAADVATDLRLSALAPNEEAPADATLATTALGAALPGWRLALALEDQSIFDTTAERRVATYLWTGSGVIAAMTVLAFFIARGFGRQVQLARLKNDLVATVSHELKTPLTAMRALVETLLDAESFDEKTTREYLQMLAQENARLSRLIENFLTFSRLERNKFTFDFAPLRPEAVVAGAVAAMGERRFATHLAPDLPAVNGDADALVTALLNLLDNAWKYSGDDKHIVLRAAAQNGTVSFAVEDHGIGLAPREKARVFERFYQADQRLARTAGGCGLGLTIVQSIVAAHRGTVEVASEAGRGSTFTLRLPAAKT